MNEIVLVDLTTEIEANFLNCTTFDKLIPRKIIKIVAIRCHIEKLKCTKSDIGWSFAPDPSGGAYRALLSLARFNGGYF